MQVGICTQKNFACKFFFGNVSFICFKMITFAAEFSTSPEKQTGERA